MIMLVPNTWFNYLYMM